MFELVHSDDVEATRAHLADLENATDPFVIRMTRRDGTVIYTEHRIVQVCELGKLVALEGIVRDVTALKSAEADLNRLALHDSLTGLPNRAQLLDRLDRALARDRRDPSVLAVLYIDVDRFKVVNDNLGHDVGDQLLGVIGHRIAGRPAAVRLRRAPRRRRVRGGAARPARRAGGGPGGRAHPGHGRESRRPRAG